MRLVTMNLDMKTIRLSLVEENDAEFILSLRLDEKYNKFLSSVSSEIEDQKKWIKQYKNEEIMKNAKAAKILEENILTESTLYEAINNILFSD